MGLHAFVSEPEHCEIYRTLFGDDTPRLFGFEEGWNVPVSRHRHNLGREQSFDGVDQYVLTLHLGGGGARRNEFHAPMARTGAISLQRPGSPAIVSSHGEVEYAHLYFRQGLLCEAADETGDHKHAELEDFFAQLDPMLSKDIEAYVLRALDTDNPPISLEMDGRAYIIALGLLRLSANLEEPSLRELEGVERDDLKPVLSEIEARLGEQIRLSELAETAKLSPCHFSRIFKSALGLTPAQYVQNRRIDRAVSLLRNTEESISAIAFNTGFSSQSHMGRLVKEALGVTPAQLRRT